MLFSFPFICRADDCPSEEPILYLNGNGDGSIVNNCCFPSTVSSSYAPEGKTLVSVSLVGNYTERSEEELVDTVKEELAGWFGSEQVHAWEFLRMYRIPYAQPNQVCIRMYDACLKERISSIIHSSC